MDVIPQDLRLISFIHIVWVVVYNTRCCPWKFPQTWLGMKHVKQLRECTY